MKNKKLNGKALAIASTVFLFAIFYISFQLYFITGYYYLYFFIALNALMFTATNLFFMAVKYEDTRNKMSLLEQKEYVKPKKHEKNKRHHFRHKNNDKEESLQEPSEEKQSILQKLNDFINKNPFIARYLKLHNFILLLCAASLICVLYFCIHEIILVIKISGDRMVFPNVSIANIFLFILMFVGVLIVDKLCAYSENNTPFVKAILNNSRIFCKALFVQFIFSAVCLILELYTQYKIQKLIIYISAAYFFFYLFFIVISFLIIGIRKEFAINPQINVASIHLFKNSSENSESFFDYLEKNTGISMRSLWSVKYIKRIAPTAILICALLLWLSTSIVIVGPYQEAAVYRIGVLQDELLQPGLHFVLPYPFDKAETYNTKTVEKVTIGYKSNESTDNIWTSSHGEDEYKLLLGGGDELVSINLRLEYKITDLKQYLKSSKSPESIMEALAYELVMEQTISTDLSSLLSVNRYEFAKNFRDELSRKLEEKNIGIEVVSVVLESIHPPVEIADVYQELISAEITAEKYILDAQAQAAVWKADAQTSYDTIVCEANAQQATKVSKAKASVEEFMASVEANKKNPSAYHYQKYLAAVSEAYSNANLVILGSGIDQSAIIFGNFGEKHSAASDKDTQKPDSTTNNAQEKSSEKTN